MKSGEGTLTTASGFQIEGKWVDDQLKGTSKVKDIAGYIHSVQWLRNQIVEEVEPIRGGEQNDNQGINIALVAASVGCGLGYLYTKKENNLLAAGAALFYGI